MNTVALWSLPAGALAADLMRNGGRCRVEGAHRRYDVILDDGRAYFGCGVLEGDDTTKAAPEHLVGRRARLVLAAVPGGMYSLVSEAVIVHCTASEESGP